MGSPEETPVLYRRSDDGATSTGCCNAESQQNHRISCQASPVQDCYKPIHVILSENTHGS